MSTFPNLSKEEEEEDEDDDDDGPGTVLDQRADNEAKRDTDTNTSSMIEDDIG